MIDVSLIDNKLLSLHYQPFWLNRLLEVILREFETSVMERHHTVQVQSFPGIDELNFGDEERLFQAFRNLISNAIKYTPDGGKITIEGRKLPGFIEVIISDTGIGIDPKDQTNIFEKFAQVGSTTLHSSGKTKFKGGGPGLGLPITKGILEAHGGTIWVESPGHDEVHCPGSSFHVLLPIYASPPDDRAAKLFSRLVHQGSNAGQSQVIQTQ
jgi:signal transduction histidine kinase